MSLKVLIVDDEKDIVRSLEMLLKRNDYIAKGVRSATAALSMMEEESFDIVISDLNMPSMDGNTFLAAVARQYPETVRIMLTGYLEIDDVMTAINQGRIWGYLSKPWDNQTLLLTIKQAMQARNVLLERNTLLKTVKRVRHNSRHQFAGFIGESTVMQFIYNAIEKAAPCQAPIFITGPSGAGKEVAAEAIHSLSTRKDDPFCAINCAAIPGELMESELFGHVKGAFSGAVSARDGLIATANGGTLFLDELGEMDILLQAKLLRFIQTGIYKKVGSDKEEQANVRFVSATNREPMDAIAEGKLREDLYYRLNVISIDMPPLNEREEDVILLAQHFLGMYAESEGKGLTGFSDEAKSLLRHYEWPGNVRQLNNVIHAAVIMADGEQIEAKDLQGRIEQSSRSIPASQAPTSQAPAATKVIREAETGLTDQSIKTLAQVEKEAIERTIAFFDDNIVQAANALGVSPSTLYRKIQQWQSDNE